MTQLWRFEATGARAVIDPGADALADADPPPALSVSVFDIDGAPHQRRLEVLFAHPPDLDAVLARAGIPPTQIEGVCVPVDDANWVQRALDRLPPVHAGRFYVRGSHHRPAPGGQVDILIDAGEAFGTGHHGTTAGCLDAMDALFKHITPPRVLDVGAGSGVLAIAAAKAVRARVDATDIDQAAVDFARRAAAQNGVANHITVTRASGVGRARPRRYPLVLANILANPLIHMAKSLSACVAPGGYVILSGLLAPQARSVLSAYRNHGLVRVHRINRDDWTTLLLQRPVRRPSTRRQPNTPFHHGATYDFL